MKTIQDHINAIRDSGESDLLEYPFEDFFEALRHEVRTFEAHKEPYLWTCTCSDGASIRYEDVISRNFSDVVKYINSKHQGYEITSIKQGCTIDAITEGFTEVEDNDANK